MKKIILGTSMLITGFLGVALIVASTLACKYNLNGSNNYADLWRLFGVTPFVIAFAVLGVIGLSVAIWGAFSKE